MKISVNYLTQEGKSFPTVELLYEIAEILNVTVDFLLNDEWWENRKISWLETGLDTKKLYTLKEDLLRLTSKDKRILSTNYADVCLFQLDTSHMKEPVYSCITCIPGSKERLAREHKYNKEICEDVAASAMNFTLQYGLKPVILKAMVLCGNYDQGQLYLMAKAFQGICEQNDVMFAGMEIAAQPINFNTEEYHVSVTVVGVQDKDKILNRRNIKEGDVLIGIKTEGMDGTNYPLLKVMLDKKTELLYEKIDGEKYFLKELLKANVSFTREIQALQEQGYLHSAFRISTSLVTATNRWCDIPEGLVACIDLTAIPIIPLYRFLFELDMIGERVFPEHFHMGIGMVVVVPENRCEEAMKVIGQFSDCWRIGQIVSDTEHKGRKILGNCETH